MIVKVNASLAIYHGSQIFSWLPNGGTSHGTGQYMGGALIIGSAHFVNSLLCAFLKRPFWLSIWLFSLIYFRLVVLLLGGLWIIYRALWRVYIQIFSLIVFIYDVYIAVNILSFDSQISEILFGTISCGSSSLRLLEQFSLTLNFLLTGLLSIIGNSAWFIILKADLLLLQIS